LSVQFKKETGIALTHYINAQKIEEAKRLLRDENMPLAVIAATLAYASQSYFSKIFQEITGETPRRYRENHFTNHETNL
jgi:YesN/AraC family two-component response regulator